MRICGHARMVALLTFSLLQTASHLSSPLSYITSHILEIITNLDHEFLIFRMNYYRQPRDGLSTASLVVSAKNETTTPSATIQ